jgi:hypothetical protein
MLLGLLLAACDDGGTQDTGDDLEDNPCAEGLWPGDPRFMVYRFSVDDVDGRIAAGDSGVLRLTLDAHVVRQRGGRRRTAGFGSDSGGLYAE